MKDTARSVFHGVIGLIGIGLVASTAPAQMNATACTDILTSVNDESSGSDADLASCYDRLPDLDDTAQIDVLRDYVRQVRDYIPYEAQEALSDRLVPRARILLRAMWLADRRSEDLPDLAVRLEALADTARVQDEPLARSRALIGLARSHYRAGRLKAFETVAVTGLEVAQATRHDELIGAFSGFLGVHAETKGELDVAVRYGETAAAAFERAAVWSGVVGTYSNISSLFLRMSDPQTALEFQDRALAISQTHAAAMGPYDLAVLAETRGETYAQMDEHELAIEWLERALRHSTDVPIKGFEAPILFDLGRSRHEMGRTERGMDDVERAVPLFIEFSNPAEAAPALVWLGQRYLERGEITRAQDALERAERLTGEDEAGQTMEEVWRVQLLDGMADVMIAKDQPGVAATYMQQALEISESRFDEEQIETLANAALRFELRDSARALALEVQQRQLDRSKLLVQRWLSVSAALGILALGMLLWITLQAYRMQKATTASKTVYIREIQHRAKNNLQILTSLLNYEAHQSLRSGLDTAHHVDTANRAAAMATVQDLIYTQEEGACIDLRAYVYRLLNLLSDSLGRDGISLSGDIADVDINVDVAVPLGLVICELVTNAYKHAFGPSFPEGTIQVRLSQGARGLRLTVIDDGIGLKTGADTSRSMGMDIVHDLAEQLDSGLQRGTQTGPGTVWVIDGIDPRV